MASTSDGGCREITMHISRHICLAVIGLLASFPVHAQSEVGSGELGVYVGGISGNGTHAIVGGTAGLIISKYAIGLFDISFSNLSNSTLRKYSGYDVTNSHLYDFNYSFHFQYPVNDKWAPYGLAGPSLIWNGFSYGTVGANGVVIHSNRDDVNFGFQTGGGVRYNIKDNWGIRPEVKVVISGRTYVVFSVGFFFNTPAGI
jgi:opacity protein-like surface antigen